jgi:predicted transcriptional regulator
MTVTSTYDELFAVLADERLRTVVSELDAAEGTLSVSQLADRLAPAACSREVSVDTIEIQLYHDYLPRLADFGFVSFDQEVMDVSTTDEFEQLERTLAVLDRTRGAVQARPDSDV